MSTAVVDLSLTAAGRVDTWGGDVLGPQRCGDQLFVDIGGFRDERGGPLAPVAEIHHWTQGRREPRLDAMTDGRFALQLSDGVTDGRKPWGLDLSVFDVNTGQVRPATTLSGGETFMAALALALGLADVVSGGMGRQIGALFVDEGFGSLDPQSLEGVVDVLRSLEDGGRIVGVISHVDEVKHALPTGITVESSPSGSVATLHYPPG